MTNAMPLPLQNSIKLLAAIEDRKKSNDEAKIIAFVGESGIGKTQAALYCAANAAAVVVRPIVCKESALVALMLEKMGLYDRATGRYATGRRDMPLQERILLASEHIKASNIPLIIDEAGSLGDAQLSMIRRMADISDAVIVLIGEAGNRARRCDDLKVKLNGIYNLQRRCAVVEAEIMNAEDVSALAKAAGCELSDEMAEYLASVSKTPSVAQRYLSAISENLAMGGKLTVSMIDQVGKGIR